jgi:hypothetical protein
MVLTGDAQRGAAGQDNPLDAAWMAYRGSYPVAASAPSSARNCVSSRSSIE